MSIESLSATIKRVKLSTAISSRGRSGRIIQSRCELDDWLARVKIIQLSIY